MISRVTTKVYQKRCNMTVFYKKSFKNFILAASIGIAAGFINGFLGAGSGIILLWILHRANPSTTPEATRDNFGSVVGIVLLLSTVSAVMYSDKGMVDAGSLFVFIPSGIIGGILGAHITDRINTEILKLIFSVIIVIAGVNMIF